jgi:hypothetical protein
MKSQSAILLPKSWSKSLSIAKRFLTITPSVVQQLIAFSIAMAYVVALHLLPRGHVDAIRMLWIITNLFWDINRMANPRHFASCLGHCQRKTKGRLKTLVSQKMNTFNKILDNVA